MNKREILFWIPIWLLIILFIPLQLLSAISQNIGGKDFGIWFWVGVIGMFAISIPYLLGILYLSKHHNLADRFEIWISYSKEKVKGK